MSPFLRYDGHPPGGSRSQRLGGVVRINHAPYIGDAIWRYSTASAIPAICARVGYRRSRQKTHAEAARRFIMADLVTKDDLEVQTLRITVRLGAMLVAGFDIMTAVIGLLVKFH
jgi:hypothetical protein